MVGLPRTRGPLAPAVFTATRVGFGRLLDATSLAPRVAPGVKVDAKPTADELRPGAKRYLAGVGLAAFGTAVAALVGAGPFDADQTPLVLGFALAMVLASSVEIPFAAGTKLYFDTAILVAVVLLFPPAVALVLISGSMLAVAALRRDPAEQTLFNIAQAVLQVTIGGVILAIAGWQVGDLDSSILALRCSRRQSGSAVVR